MRNSEQIKIKLYIALAVLVVTFACICVYRSAVSQKLRPARIMDDQVAGTDQTQTEQDMQDNRPVNASAGRIDVSSDHGSMGDANDSKPARMTYTLVVADGYLQVYIQETGKLYMETGIVYELLPEQVREQIDAGKHFDTEETMLEFLESYSS